MPEEEEEEGTGRGLSVASSHGFSTLEHCTGGFQPTDKLTGKENLRNWVGQMA